MSKFYDKFVASEQVFATEQMAKTLPAGQLGSWGNALYLSEGQLGGTMTAVVGSIDLTEDGTLYKDIWKETLPEDDGKILLGIFYPKTTFLGGWINVTNSKVEIDEIYTEYEVYNPVTKVNDVVTVPLGGVTQDIVGGQDYQFMNILALQFKHPDGQSNLPIWAKLSKAPAVGDKINVQMQFASTTG